MFAQKGSLTRKCVWLFVLLYLLFGARAFAQQDSSVRKDLFQMSLEELTEVNVVSASRQEQKISEISVPISIITAEDIHYSGLTSIPEILQFEPGVDVLRTSRFRYAVGIRGLHDVISDKTLVLINGRSTYSSVYGGAEWFRLPLFPEDIERIEIVRGPSGASWGANAFNGVINIITKNPDDVLGYFGSTTITEFGDSFTHLRWAEKKDKWSWRSSLGYEDQKSSDEAGAGDYKSSVPSMNALIGFDTYSAQDFSRNLITDNEFVYQPSDWTKLSLGVGHSNKTSGNFETGGLFPSNHRCYETTRLFSRIDRKFEDGSSGSLQWFGNLERSGLGDQLSYHNFENDFEGQLNFAPIGNHHILIGGNVRLIRINSKSPTAESYKFEGEPFDEQLVGIFGIDRWKITDRFTIEGQLRGDWYSETQTDWSGRLTGLYALDDNKDHILRFSAAKAFRSPMAAIRNVTVERFAIGPDLYLMNVVKSSHELENEETWSLEAGYTGKLAKGLTLQLDGYYQHYDNLIGIKTGPDPLGLGRFFISVENIADAEAWGGECELAYENKRGKLSAWYSYNDFRTEKSHQDIRAYQPAKHKAGLTGRLFLPDNWAFNVNYKFTDTTPGNPNGGDDIGSSHRLDLTISKKIAKGRGELMLGVSDILVKTRESVLDLGAYTAHETPGRMFFARLQLKF